MYVHARPPFQPHRRPVLTDDFLRVKGSPDGSIFAIGDAATIDQPKALDYADQLFAQVGVHRCHSPQCGTRLGRARKHWVGEKGATETDMHSYTH